MNNGLSLAIPCRADEPGLGATLASLYTACQHPSLPGGQIEELLICVNGVERGAASPSEAAVREFCSQHGVPLREVWLTSDRKKDAECHSEPKWSGGGASPSPEDFVRDSPACGLRMTDMQRLGSETLPIPICTLLLTERRGKPPAWNVLWRCATGKCVLFCDADVRVDREAVWLLWATLRDAPDLSLVAAREVPVLVGKGTLWSRMGAIPYRFDFGNAGGRLLVLRRDALPQGMPEDLLLEDAWLTVAVGRNRVAKEWRAKVYFLPPATGRDYFAERVRTEGGKLQIRRMHGHLLQGGPIASYRWPQFFHTIALNEYPLVFFAVLVRGLAHLWARLALINKDFYALYRPFLTTKEWSET